MRRNIFICSDFRSWPIASQSTCPLSTVVRRVRDVEAVTDLAMASGFDNPIIEQMPADNLSLVFRRLAW